MKKILETIKQALETNFWGEIVIIIKEGKVELIKKTETIKIK